MPVASLVKKAFTEAADFKKGQAVKVLTPNESYTGETGLVYGVNAEKGRLVVYFEQFDVDHAEPEKAAAALAYIKAKGIKDSRATLVDGDVEYETRDPDFPSAYIFMYPKHDKLVPVGPG